MTLKEFADIVADMRHCQKEYFRTRSGDALSKSKTAERRVDQALASIADGQKRMFDDPADEKGGRRG